MHAGGFCPSDAVPIADVCCDRLRMCPWQRSDLYERFKREMSEDFIFRFDNNEELGIEAGYADLERRLNQNGKSLSNFGMALPTRSLEEITGDSEVINETEERRLGEEMSALLNSEQKLVVDEILEQLESGDTPQARCHFIDGLMGPEDPEKRSFTER
ncbi:hypothetical protein L596_027971 [Steinernema carpocapsae]|uniref:Uncharacterized protein n=1 Tax=Steinernema carpocapsae TaxID=34508 RepID=A0A4U5LX31_STECR|nr:hypothetical protein L596_027971 [Steinernema carpocapsae]